jgi:exodeoxyribonuclease VII large subunit
VTDHSGPRLIAVPKIEPILYGDRRVFPVSAFNRGLAMWVAKLPVVWVEGEVTELRRREAWANVFFTLKEAATGASLSVTMARHAFDRLELGLTEGERVHVEGKPEVMQARATLSLRATTIERFGLGEHLAAIERLKAKLEAEGLFADARKRSLPPLPRGIGLLTGVEAAARGDIVTAVATRFPPARIVVCETRVQGRGAPESIVNGLRRLAAHPAVDVVILARGGGSFEDLLPFSAEAVVRAVAACPVPVVSAVGNEQDTPLCDLAADVRASTPTAAARLVVPDLDSLLGSLARARDDLTRGLQRCAARDRERVLRTGDRLRTAPSRLLERKRVALAASHGRLRALSPQATLSRGYAIVRRDGRVLRDAAHAAAGDPIEVELARGGLGARVEDVRA